MEGMLSAEGAILIKLKAIARVFLVLNSVVVSLLAFLTSQRNFYACVCSHNGTSLLN